MEQGAAIGGGAISGASGMEGGAIGGGDGRENAKELPSATGPGFSFFVSGVFNMGARRSVGSGALILGECCGGGGMLGCIP